jgi:hypothetical protein
MRDPEFFLERFVPVTTGFAFLEFPFRRLCDAMLEREKAVNAMWGFPFKVKAERIRAPLDQKLEHLLPLTVPVPTRLLLIETRSDWVAWLENKARSPDPGSQPRYMGRQLRARRLSLMISQEIPDQNIGSTQFIFEDDTRAPALTRTIAAHKESRWEFSEHGPRLPFEEVEAYSARRIKDRLTPEMVERYCGHFGIELFDPDFYDGEGFLIHSYAPPMTQYFNSFGYHPPKRR